MLIAEVVTATGKKIDLSGNPFKAECHANKRPLKSSRDCVSNFQGEMEMEK